MEVDLESVLVGSSVLLLLLLLASSVSVLFPFFFSFEVSSVVLGLILVGKWYRSARSTISFRFNNRRYLDFAWMKSVERRTRRNFSSFAICSLLEFRLFIPIWSRAAQSSAPVDTSKKCVSSSSICPTESSLKCNSTVPHAFHSLQQSNRDNSAREKDTFRTVCFASKTKSSERKLAVVVATELLFPASRSSPRKAYRESFREREDC